MSAKKNVLLTTAIAFLSLAGGAAAFSAVIPEPVKVSATAVPATNEEYQRTIEAMKPPKRARPLAVVLGDNRGTETIDFLIPYAVLKRSGEADVVAVGMSGDPLKLRPALTVETQATAAQFDRRFPDGADYVVVPAMSDHQDPRIHAWIRSQAARGATIVAICSGAEILANAGLLRYRSATTHWTSVRKILEAEPTMRWVPNRRYVADRGIVTTTGVSAAIPVSIALVEAIAGRTRAQSLAKEIGVAEWGRAHDSAAYRIGTDATALLANRLALWKHEDVVVPVADGVDEIALALTADSWSRTFRSQAVTLASAPRVRTRYGLGLVSDRQNRVGIERVLAPVDGRQPAHALDRTLAEIASTYGPTTARLVAVQLEYDGRL